MARHLLAVVARVALIMACAAAPGMVCPSPMAGQAAPETLTLEQALARARATRPQVSAATGAVDRARGTSRVTSLVPNPLAAFETDEHAAKSKLTFLQPLGWLTRRSADRATGQALVSRALADSAQVLANLGRDVRRAFYGALAAEELLRLAMEQSAIADSLVASADRRVRAGDLSELARDQVAQEAGRARLQVLQARESAMVARAELGRAVGWAGAGAAPFPSGPLDDALDDMLATGVASAADSFPQETVPALMAGVADSAAASNRWRAARTSQIPIPALLAGTEWTNGASSVNGVPGDTRRVILGFAMPVPLWNQGQQAVAEAEGAASEAAALAAETRLTFITRLAQARIRVRASAQRAQFSRDSLLQDARRIRAGIVRVYEADQSGVLPVFDALRTERDVARSTAQELLAFQEARADLDALLGRWPWPITHAAATSR